MDMSNTLNGMLGTTSSGENIVKLVLESGIVDKIVNGLPIILIMIILTFIVYTLAIGILASVTTSMEDFNQIQTPIMILLMAGYMLSIYSALFKGAVFLKVMSYIPFISGVLAPVMYMLGEVTLIDIGISIAILLATIFVLYKYGLRVYKVGILNYSSSNLWKKIFNALKQRD
jgi:ABC-2 type transport system permease protein